MAAVEPLFGEPVGDDQNSHKFTGKELNDESGLYYFCQRYYDSNIGRFITLDPQGSTSSNPYAYCMNNPLNLIDPTGQQSRDIREEVIPGWRGGKLYDAAFENWWAAKTQGWMNPLTARMSQMFPGMFFKGLDRLSGNFLISYTQSLSFVIRKPF